MGLSSWIESSRKRNCFSEASKEAPYFTTNESLASIVKGLEIKKGDNVFCVCGSGDQAFAVAELASHVFAVDLNNNAVALARERRDFLKKGRVDLFSYFSSRSSDVVNRGYFNNRRLGLIRENCDNINIEQGDIWDMKIRPWFTKIHLSNVFHYIGCSKTDSEIEAWAERAFSDSQEGTLIYSALALPKRIKFPKFLELNKDLTSIARWYSGGNWRPAIYEKV